jgi:hypothetical protein
MVETGFSRLTISTDFCFLKTGFGDVAAYPVMVVVLAGCSFGTWFSIRTLKSHNDVIGKCS